MGIFNTDKSLQRLAAVLELVFLLSSFNAAVQFGYTVVYIAHTGRLVVVASQEGGRWASGGCSGTETLGEVLCYIYKKLLQLRKWWGQWKLMNSAVVFETSFSAAYSHGPWGQHFDSYNWLHLCALFNQNQWATIVGWRMPLVSNCYSHLSASCADDMNRYQLSISWTPGWLIFCVLQQHVFLHV